MVDGASFVDTKSPQGDSVCLAGTMMITKPSDFGDGNVFLANSGLEGERGYFISVECNNPNGIDVDGNPNAINIAMEDMSSRGGQNAYETNKRIVAKYGRDVSMPENAQQLFPLDKELSPNMVYTTNADNKYVWLLKKFDVTFTVFFNDNPASEFAGASATVYDQNGEIYQSGSLDNNGKVTFTGNSGCLDGDYTYVIQKDSLQFGDKFAVNDNNETLKIDTYSVDFENNEHGTKPVKQIIQKGQKATDPGVFETGYTLNGWYTDSEFTNK